MRKVVLYIAASLDNFIAKPDGSVAWLHHPEYTIEGEDYGYAAFRDSIDTTLMGNNTYREILGFGVPFPYQGLQNYVFSRSAPTEKREFVQFVTEAIPNFVKRLKEEPGKDIWLIGGGQINSLLLSNGLIDKMILTLIPVVLGTGIRLFAESTTEQKFALENNRHFTNGLVKLTFSINRLV